MISRTNSDASIEVSKVDSSINSDSLGFSGVDQGLEETPKKKDKSKSLIRQRSKDSVIKQNKAKYANSIEETEKRKKKLLIEMTPFLKIKEKLKMLAFFKAMLENIIIMLIWFSTIFKQDIYSFLLFIMLIYYTYSRSGRAMVIVRTTTIVLVFVQYLS